MIYESKWYTLLRLHDIIYAFRAYYSSKLKCQLLLLTLEAKKSVAQYYKAEYVYYQRIIHYFICNIGAVLLLRLLNCLSV